MQLTERLRSETCEKKTESDRSIHTDRWRKRRGILWLSEICTAKRGTMSPGNFGTIRWQVGNRPDAPLEKAPHPLPHR